MTSIYDPVLPCSPPNDKLAFCVGRTRVNFGTWYVPNGKTSQEFTYCEYCIENGCASRDEVYQAVGNARNTNCDCPRQKEHPLFQTLECPVCIVKGIGMMRAASCGICTECGNSTPYTGQTYCSGCSWDLKACYECGQKINEGNSYLEDVKKIIDKRINRTKSMHVSEKYIQEDISRYGQIYGKTVQLYSNRSKEEMINLLSVNTKK